VTPIEVRKIKGKNLAKVIEWYENHGSYNMDIHMHLSG
jgi:hypothetical protein